MRSEPGPEIRWIEPSAFRRARARVTGRGLRPAWRRLLDFVRVAAGFVVVKALMGWIRDGRDPLDVPREWVVIALATAAFVALVVPFIFRYSRAGATVDGAGITIVRLTHSPLMVESWPWAVIEGVEIGSMTLEGRAFDVLLVRTTDGATHPIGLDREADRAAIFARAEAAGLREDDAPEPAGSEDDARTEAAGAGSSPGDCRPG